MLDLHPWMVDEVNVLVEYRPVEYATKTSTSKRNITIADVFQILFIHRLCQVYLHKCLKNLLAKQLQTEIHKKLQEQSRTLKILAMLLQPFKDIIKKKEIALSTHHFLIPSEIY